jgi:hypothetical protein
MISVKPGVWIDGLVLKQFNKLNDISNKSVFGVGWMFSGCED